LIPRSLDPSILSSGSIHPSAVIGPDVTFGSGCEVGPFCVLEGRVTVGAANRFAPGVAIGGPPMDTKYRGEDTEVRIGSGNTFFEYATVHRATGPGNATVIGDRNFVMAYVHVAHNCRVGSDCVIANGVQLAGHVELGDGANVGGLAGIHQYCRIGTLAMVGACSYVNKDIPPFMLAAGNPCRVRGLNVVGLQRAGIGEPVLSVLHKAHRVIYRAGLNLAQVLSTIEGDLLPASDPGRGQEQLLDIVRFVRSSARGIELRGISPMGPI
jgi:UDP-N-acetylglucosamine acyltransferase